VTESAEASSSKFEVMQMLLEIKDNQAALRDKIAVLRAEFFEERQTMQVILDAKVNSI